MTVTPKQWLGGTLLAAVALLVGCWLVVFAWPPADDLSFKKRGNEEKQFVTRVGEAIVKAAHPTAKKLSLVKYEFTQPKPNRTELVLKMEYHGAVTGKKYVADIVVKIDSSDKDAWEVVNIDFTDNNNISASQNRIQELIKELNK
jgi:hypothetical protein